MAARRKLSSANPPRISVGLPPEHLKRLELLAGEHERSVAWLIRHAVKLFLDELDKGQLSLNLGPGADLQ